MSSTVEFCIIFPRLCESRFSSFLMYFPPKHQLHGTLSRNTVKISYRCMPNVSQVISRHNKTCLNANNINQPENDDGCKCKPTMPTEREMPHEINCIPGKGNANYMQHTANLHWAHSQRIQKQIQRTQKHIQACRQK